MSDKKNVLSKVFTTPNVNVAGETEKRARGRQYIPKAETPKPFEGSPSEELFLNADDFYLPFSSSIRADLYIKLKRIENVRKQSIRVMFETMLEDFIKNNKEAANTPLPVKKVEKLKQLKGAMDFYNSRKTE